MSDMLYRAGTLTNTILSCELCLYVSRIFLVPGTILEIDENVNIWVEHIIQCTSKDREGYISCESTKST